MDKLSTKPKMRITRAGDMGRSLLRDLNEIDADALTLEQIRKLHDGAGSVIRSWQEVDTYLTELEEREHLCRK